KIPNTKLKQILKKAKDKKDLIERLTSYDPDYKFIQDNFQDMREKYESNGETMKAIATMWKT
ncbi:15816_t:CDS:2, partial [Racocetra fulgida]